MRNLGVFGMSLFILVLILVDIYTFKGLKDLLKNVQWASARKIFYILFWVLNLAFYVIWIYVFIGSRIPGADIPYQFVLTGFGTFLMFFVPKLIFITFVLINDIGHWIVGLLKSPSSTSGEMITRNEFLVWIGAFIAAIPLVSLGWGMLYGRFRFTVRREKLAFKNLPSDFNGLKVVQISDLHLGSFYENFEKVEAGLKMIRDLKPDLILFTGDLVNNTAKEAEPWIDVFRKLEAPLGKMSVLGNHDYGDYSAWNSPAEKVANLDRLKAIHKEMGFDLLLNENRKITRNGKSITIAGVENWGLPPFPQHGNLGAALAGTDSSEFQLLMSHDPSHFDAEVTQQSEVDLTLSGHTHGMQFGVELGNIKWSPVKYKYPKWAGRYQTDQQILYVNRGFGYIGYPGRVGIMPEITLFELEKQS